MPFTRMWPSVTNQAKNGPLHTHMRCQPIVSSQWISLLCLLVEDCYKLTQLPPHNVQHTMYHLQCTAYNIPVTWSGVQCTPLHLPPANATIWLHCTYVTDRHETALHTHTSLRCARERETYISIQFSPPPHTCT
jgi:hypothetical protein